MAASVGWPPKGISCSEIKMRTFTPCSSRRLDRAGKQTWFPEDWFSRRCLHLRVAQTARIGKDGESVALEAVSRENINLDDVKTARALLRNRVTGMAEVLVKGRPG